MDPGVSLQTSKSKAGFRWRKLTIHKAGVTVTLLFNIVPFTVEVFVIVFGLPN
jgi:hypothetical protein